MVLVGDALVVVLVVILVAVVVAVATAVTSVSPAFLSRCSAEKKTRRRDRTEGRNMVQTTERAGD